MVYDFKLYELVASLTNQECRQLRKMLKSPFFTRRKDLSDLFEVLIKYRSKGRDFPKQEQLHKLVFPSREWNGSRLRGSMSDLLELIEECLIINHYKTHKAESKLLLAGIYRQRNLRKNFTAGMKKVNLLIGERPKRNAEYYEYRRDLQYEQMRYLSMTKRTENLMLQEVANSIDDLYLIQKLQITCAQLSHQLVHKVEYDYGLLYELLEKIDQERYLKIPAIAIFYYCFKFLTEKDNLDYFKQFRHLLSEYSHQFTKDDLGSPYRLALNFCIRKANEGISSFNKDIWDLFKKGFEKEILLENNYIPRFTFNNGIAAALRLQEWDWIEKFIAENASQLEPTFKEQTISFNLARLEYERKDYDKALIHLQGTETKDVMNNMISKMLLSKVYVQLKEFETLQYHLDSFDQFIRRNAVSDYHQKNVLNLIKYLRKVISTPHFEANELAKLRSQVEAEAILSERRWLLDEVLA